MILKKLTNMKDLKGAEENNKEELKWFGVFSRKSEAPGDKADDFDMIFYESMAEHLSEELEEEEKCIGDLLDEDECEELNALMERFYNLSEEIYDLDTRIRQNILNLSLKLKLELKGVLWAEVINKRKIPEAEITSKINETIDMVKRMNKLELELIHTLIKMILIDFPVEMDVAEVLINYEYTKKERLERLKKDIENYKKKADKIGELLIRLNDYTNQLVQTLKRAEQNASEERVRFLDYAKEISDKIHKLNFEIDRIPLHI
ncbi:MAG: hypothetical protein QXF82_07325 [Nitrososphaeria archaeon]